MLSHTRGNRRSWRFRQFHSFYCIRVSVHQTPQYVASLLNDGFRYLRNTSKYSFLRTEKAQLTVSLSCIFYLQSSLDLVDPRVAEDEKRIGVLLCLHELHLYAIDHWVDHLLALSNSLGSHSGVCELEPLLRALERLTDMHQNLVTLQGSRVCNEEETGSTQREDRWQLLGISPAARNLLDRVLVHQQTVSTDGCWPKEPHCKCAAFQWTNLPILSSVQLTRMIIILTLRCSHVFEVDTKPSWKNLWQGRNQTTKLCPPLYHAKLLGPSSVVIEVALELHKVSGPQIFGRNTRRATARGFNALMRHVAFWAPHSFHELL